MNILKLENNVEITNQIKSALTTQQLHISCTDTLHEAIFFLFEHECVLIFVDMNYCNGDNVDFLKSIRKKIMTPIIILSDIDTFTIKKEAIEKGAINPI